MSEFPRDKTTSIITSTEWKQMYVRLMLLNAGLLAADNEHEQDEVAA